MPGTVGTLGTAIKSLQIQPITAFKAVPGRVYWSGTMGTEMICKPNFQYPDWAPSYLRSRLEAQPGAEGENQCSTEDNQKFVVSHALCSHTNMEKIWIRLEKANAKTLKDQPWREDELGSGGWWSQKFANEVHYAYYGRSEWDLLTKKQKSNKHADIKNSLEKLAQDLNTYPLCRNIFLFFTEEELCGTRDFFLGEALRDQIPVERRPEPNVDDDPYFMFEKTAPPIGELLLRVAHEMTEEPDTVVKQPGNSDAHMHFFVRTMGSYTKALFGKYQYGLLRDLAEVFFPEANLDDEKRIRDILK